MTLDHISLVVSSEAGIKFYESLGFQVTERIKRTYDEVVFMEFDGIVLEIFVDPNHPDRLSGPEAKGLRHIGLAVDSIEAFGVKKEMIRVDWHGRKFAFINDPDGQPIELKER